ncbi:hypothetical protein ACJRO7_036193 [Eucalyptus globulus]|uniref:Peptidase S54 rhomboid domain-containing protein n=1 Tax=Eucalyptus globulus TaxID=34317 RepID=A0ABD3J9V6_EUCGL
MRGLSANPTPPSYHQHCPFRQLGKLIVSSSSGSMAIHLITDATSLRLGHCLISSSFQSPFLQRIEFLQLSKDAFHPHVSSSFQFSDGSKDRTDGTSSPERPRKKSSEGRHMTNAVIAVNILVYAGQLATWGKLFTLQMNHLINKGQWWRLATSNFLYANVAHLVLNCCCLDALGPNVEALSGPERFPMVYATSAIASSATSYWLTKAPSIGASSKFRIGEHRGLTGDANEDLKYIARIIIINLFIRSSVKGIDYWRHVFRRISWRRVAPWLLDPAGKLERRSSDGGDIINNIKGREDPAQP